MVALLRVVNLILLLVALIMFLNLVGVFSFLGGYFVLFVIAAAGFSLLILAILVFRSINRSNERAKNKLPKLGWQFVALIFVVIMGGAFPSASRTLSMNAERECEENLVALGRSVERYAAEKGSPPGSLEQLLRDKYLDDIPKVGGLPIIYRIYSFNGRNSFVLICPLPWSLLKACGFLPARKCRDIRYSQVWGLVVETE
jgi:hypothetical protein